MTGKGTLSMERGGCRFVIDLHTQMVGEVVVSLDSEAEEGEGRRKEKDGTQQRRNPKTRGRIQR
jgi:hypothetical protein